MPLKTSKLPVAIFEKTVNLFYSGLSSGKQFNLNLTSTSILCKTKKKDTGTTTSKFQSRLPEQ